MGMYVINPLFSSGHLTLYDTDSILVFCRLIQGGFLFAVSRFRFLTFAALQQTTEQGYLGGEKKYSKPPDPSLTTHKLKYDGKKHRFFKILFKFSTIYISLKYR